MDHLLPKQLYREKLIRIPKRDKLARYTHKLERIDREACQDGECKVARSTNCLKGIYRGTC
jgi:hypothetical protein